MVKINYIFLIILLTSCHVPDNISDIKKYEDKENNVICYVHINPHDNAISCVKK